MNHLSAQRELGPLTTSCRGTTTFCTLHLTLTHKSLLAQRDLGNTSNQLQGHKGVAAHSSMSDYTAATDVRREFREFKRRVQVFKPNLNNSFKRKTLITISIYQSSPISILILQVSCDHSGCWCSNQ